MICENCKKKCPEIPTLEFKDKKYCWDCIYKVLTLADTESQRKVNEGELPIILKNNRNNMNGLL